MRSLNQWHRSLYDKFLAEVGLDSKQMRKKAHGEVAFLANALNLSPSSKILDVPCGTGRHSRLLAKRGHAVTGVDISIDCLHLAKRHCKGTDVVLRRGDMKNLKWAHGKFNAVINMFSSFGYFKTDQENEAVMRELVRCLKPGGKLVIQTINRDFLLTIFDPARWGEQKGYYWQEGARYDSATKYVEAQRIYIEKKTNRAHRAYHRMRLYSAKEMMALMQRCGLRQLRVYGDATGAKFNRKKSTHPFYIGMKVY